MIDGLRPDAIDQFDCPNLKSVIAAGASTLTARSVMPSYTLPCHTTIFHSIMPTRHGITKNEWRPYGLRMPGLIEYAQSSGLRSAFFHNWEPLRDLNKPESLYFSYYLDNSRDAAGDEDNARAFASLIDQIKPDFAFMYLGVT